MRRKRVRNEVSNTDRCKALRASGERCSRRRKGDDIYCGTHLKGLPNGKITDDIKDDTHLELTVLQVRGIHMYVDKYNNIYSTEDVLSKSTNPAIIGKLKENDVIDRTSHETSITV